MARNFVKYTPQVRGYTASDINLSFDDYKAMATVNQDLENRIGSVLSFSLKGLSEEALQVGKKYGAENAITAEQFMESDPVEISKIIPKGTSTFSVAARNAMLSRISSEIKTKGEMKLSQEFEQVFDDFGNIKLTTEIGPDGKNYSSSQQFLNNLNETKNGFVDVMRAYSPEIAEKLDASLTTYSNSLYKDFLGKEASLLKQEQQLEVLEYSTSLFANFDHYIKPVLFFSADEQEILGRTTIEQNYNNTKESYEMYLQERLPVIGAKEYERLTDLFDENWSKAKQTFLDKTLISISDNDFVETEDGMVRNLHTLDIATEVLKGGSAMEFITNADEKELAGLDENEKTDLLIAAEIIDTSANPLATAQSLIDNYKQMQELQETKEKDIERNNVILSRQYVDDYVKATTPDAAADALQKLFAVDPDRAVSISKLDNDLRDVLRGEDTLYGVSSPGLYAKVENDVVQGNKGIDDILAYGEDPESDDYLNPQDRKKLIQLAVDVDRAKQQFEQSPMDFEQIEDYLTAITITNSLTRQNLQITSESEAKGSLAYNATLQKILSMSPEEIQTINTTKIDDLFEASNVPALKIRKEQIVGEFQTNLSSLNGRKVIINGENVQLPLFHNLNSSNYQVLLKAINYFKMVETQQVITPGTDLYPTDIHADFKRFMLLDDKNTYKATLNTIANGKYDNVEINEVYTIMPDPIVISQTGSTSQNNDVVDPIADTTGYGGLSIGDVWSQIVESDFVQKGLQNVEESRAEKDARQVELRGGNE